MKTIIAAFCDQASAQQAVDFLRSRRITDHQLLSHRNGNVLDRLRSFSIPEERAEIYAEAMRRGAPVLVLHTEDRDASTLASALDSLGSLDLDASATRWRSEGWSRYDAGAEPYDDRLCASEAAMLSQDSNLGAATTGQDGQSEAGSTGDIEVVEERVGVGKRAVSRGGVRVRSFVVERPVREEVQLREEHIDVTREPVDQPISGSATDSTFTEDEFVVTAIGEEAVVGKEARVVERVHIGKTADTRTETIEETERRRDVEVEPIETEPSRTRRP